MIGISLLVEWTSTILFIIATRTIVGKQSSDPRIRLKSLWMFIIGSSCLIAFALLLGAWRFILYFEFDNISGLGLLVGQSFIVYYDAKGIINCRREIHENTM